MCVNVHPACPCVCAYVCMMAPVCEHVHLGVLSTVWFPWAPWVSVGAVGVVGVRGCRGCPWVSVGVRGCSWVLVGVCGCACVLGRWA